MNASGKWTPRATVLFVFFLAMLTGLTFLRILAPVSAENSAEQSSEASAPTIPQNVYDKISPATVEILVDGRLSGSGWIVDPKGLIMTAEHVLSRPGRKVEVLTKTHKRLPATVLAVNCAHDLALLQIDSQNKTYPAFELSDHTPPAGTPAYVFGAPVFRHDIMLAGRVARNSTAFEWYGSEKEYIEIVHFSALAPQGMSGGVWVDAQGRAVGLQSGAMVLDGGHVGVSFVAPIEPVRQLIKSQKTAKTATLAIACEEIWEQANGPVNENGPVSGLIVRIVCDPGPAAAAGLQPNDIITAVNGKPVQYRDDLLREVRSHKPGEKITLLVLKSGQSMPQQLELTLACLEQEWHDYQAK